MGDYYIDGGFLPLCIECMVIIWGFQMVTLGGHPHITRCQLEQAPM